MLFIHFANVYLADLTEEDPCSLYLINFLLDATIGMLLIYVGVRAVSVLVEWQQWESLRFGEYGDPLQCGAWVGQCALYIVIMIFEKSVVFIVLLILQWKKVALLNPIENPDLKLAIVMLIVPFFVNVSAMLHFPTPVCSLASSVLFTVQSLTEKAPFGPHVPLCERLPLPIPSPDKEIAGSFSQQANPVLQAPCARWGIRELCLALPARGPPTKEAHHTHDKDF
uniref:Transmembrane protein 110 n=1 Tax=Suricata suricatta TaxID=37032 RepID=A0A673UM57_SURSU